MPVCPYALAEAGPDSGAFHLLYPPPAGIPAHNNWRIRVSEATARRQNFRIFQDWLHSAADLSGQLAKVWSARD